MSGDLINIADDLLPWRLPCDAIRPVELLRDQRGVYGVGVPDLFDFEATAWASGVEPGPLERTPSPLILRPDRFSDSRPGGAVLQKITGGFRRGLFWRSHEERLRQFIHHTALNRAGLPWPPPQDEYGTRWWSADKGLQARNRARYHGLRRQSLDVINRLLGKALEEAADTDAVRAARRFAFSYREAIYRACALSRRALQLTETFPVLALAIYADWEARDYSKSWETASAERRHCRSEAASLVDRGARLRAVAGAMDIPMALRHIKPGVAHLATDILCRHPELLSFMPGTLPRQRIWLHVVRWALRSFDAGFGAWAARHIPQIPGRSAREVGSFLGDLADWGAGPPPDENRRPEPRAGREFITRPFVSTMSLKTVTELSAKWHEAVANSLDGPDQVFPTPWYPAAKIGNTEIVPIENAASLYREGQAMHHCVGTYSDTVLAGHFCIYSVKRDGARVATLALGRYREGKNCKVYIEQIRGACNSTPPPVIIAMVQRWLRAQPKLPVPPTKQEKFGDAEELEELFF